jgi:predicted GNAT family acetyltransferase
VNFPEVAENEVNICHTFVDSSLRGKGIADKITKELAEHLKKTNKKAHATCSYAISWFESHPEYNGIYLDKK